MEVAENEIIISGSLSNKAPLSSHDSSLLDDLSLDNDSRVSEYSSHTDDSLLSDDASATDDSSLTDNSYSFDPELYGDIITDLIDNVDLLKLDDSLASHVQHSENTIIDQPGSTLSLSLPPSLSLPSLSLSLPLPPPPCLPPSLPTSLPLSLSPLPLTLSLPPPPPSLSLSLPLPAFLPASHPLPLPLPLIYFSDTIGGEPHDLPEKKLSRHHSVEKVQEGTTSSANVTSVTTDSPIHSSPCAHVPTRPSLTASSPTVNVESSATGLLETTFDVDDLSENSATGSESDFFIPLCQRMTAI